ncbi:MAG: Gfo/Idh/MocA family oxidoreductase [Isosphaeraceae bacterium]
MTGSLSRRSFSQSALAAAAATALAPGRVRGANDRVRLGFIGVGNRGCQLLTAFLPHEDAQVVALCDVYEPYLHAAYDQVDPRFQGLGKRIPRMPELGSKVDRVSDFRRLLDRKDIDAIVIATPDHWHAVQMTHACRAGKDVYVEKPLSVTINEGRRMIEVARETQRVVQVGTHRRSSALYARMAKALGPDKAIGRVGTARAGYASNMTPDGIGRDSGGGVVPKGLDWNLWLGPRPERPFRSTVMPYKFRWHSLYSSQVANWGVHYFDLIRWLTGESEPSSVSAYGRSGIINDDRTIPESVEAVLGHESGLLVSFSLTETSGHPLFPDGAEVEVRGTEGTAFANTSRYWIVPERGGQFQDPKPRRKAETVAAERDGRETDLDRLHARNFLDCVKSRATPHADIAEGHRSTMYAHLVNLALATGERLEWDAKSGRFRNSEAANNLLHYEYRRPWTLG